MSRELEVRNLSFGYHGAEKVLRGMSFSASSGELVSILGKNGAGKSTLFKCILGLIRDYDGEILIGEENIKNIPPRSLARKVAYIPQSHYHSFNYSVLDMVLMGSASRLGNMGSPGKKEEKEAFSALEKAGVLDLSEKGYAEISGGEQQLVLMARAMMQNARIWILDEPLASLDYGNQIRVLRTLKELAGTGNLILQSIHNPGQAGTYSDRILAVKDGTVIANGRPDGLLTEGLIKELYGADVPWP